MKILIATGIYPPEIGGPAQYAYNTEQEFRRQGHSVTVKYFGKIERTLPTGLRHLYFLLKTAVAYVRADLVIVLDTFSVAWPISILSRLSSRGYIIRTGGDFLWESYVERTKKKVLFKDFYQTEIPFFSRKEKLIFNITKKVLAHSTHVVFSTKWQQDIFLQAYSFTAPTSIIENYYDVAQKKNSENEISTIVPTQKVFLTSTRNLCWKNKDILIKCLEKVKADRPAENIVIDNNTYTHKEFLEKIKNSYAVALMSLGDISPNMILDSIRQGTPFVLTKENGINDRIAGLGVTADPLDETAIYNAIVEILRPEVYMACKTKLSECNYTHSWTEICKEYIHLYDTELKHRPRFGIKRFFKNIFTIGLAQTFTTGCAFVVNILMANVLSAFVFGTYKFLTSWISMLTIAGLPQIQYTYGNAVARGKVGGYKQIVLQKIKYGLIGSAVAGIMAAYYAVMHNYTLSISFLIIALTIPFLDALTLYNGYFQGKREYIQNAKAVIAQSLFTYILIIGIFLLTQSIILLVAGYMLAWILPRIPLNKKLSIESGSASTQEVREIVQYGKRLTLYDSILYVTQFADKLVLFYLIGAREVAVYTIATAFPDQIKSYVKNLYFMLQARFATSSLARVFSNTKKITLISLGFLILTTLLYIVCAPLLINIFFPTYPDAVNISILYALGIASALFTIPSLAMRAHNKEKELVKVHTFRGITYCILVFVGTKYFGIVGTVIGKIIGDYIYAVSYYVMMYKVSAREKDNL